MRVVLKFMPAGWRYSVHDLELSRRV